MSRSIRVLIVEDEKDGREALQAVVEMWGHQVDAVETGSEGLRLGQTGSYDAVILDLNLPDIDGLEVGRVLAQMPKRPYIIAHTAYARPMDQGRTRQAGFDIHIAKASMEALNAMENTLAELRDRTSPT